MGGLSSILAFWKRTREPVENPPNEATHFDFDVFYARALNPPNASLSQTSSAEIETYIRLNGSIHAKKYRDQGLSLDHSLTEDARPKHDALANDKRGLLRELVNNPDGAYLVIENKILDGNLDLEGETINRPLRFRNCIIRGKFWAKDAQLQLLSFYNCEIDELRLHRAVITQSLILHNCKIYRGVQMRGSKIGQSVSFNGSVLGCGQSKVALDLRNSHIGHSLYMSINNADYWGAALEETIPTQDESPFKADGVIRLSGSRVGGSIDFRAAYIKGKRYHNTAYEESVTTAVEAYGIQCGASVHLSRGFHAIGEINFKRARIDLLMDCSYAKFDNGGDPKADALYLRYAVVGTEFFFRFSNRVNGSIDLVGMETNTLHDDIESWNLENIGEQGGYIRLNGLTYDRLVIIGDLRERMRWLGAQPPGEGDGQKAGYEFRPQPWTQIANVLEKAGNLARAEEFRYERDYKRLLADPGIPLRPNDIGSFVWRHIIVSGHYLLNGFDRRPLRAVGLSLAIISICMLVFLRAYDIGMIKPSQPVVILTLQENQLETVKAARATESSAVPNLFAEPQGMAISKLVCVPRDYETFNPVLYSVDVFLPFLDFHQEANWAVRLKQDNSQLEQSCRAQKPQITYGFPTEVLHPADWLVVKFAKGISQLERTLGWLLTIMAGLAFTGTLRQNL